jgi:hypothetical protein
VPVSSGREVAFYRKHHQQGLTPELGAVELPGVRVAT